MLTFNILIKRLLEFNIISLHLRSRKKELIFGNRFEYVENVKFSCVQEHGVKNSKIWPLKYFILQEVVDSANSEVAGGRGVAMLVSQHLKAKRIFSNDFAVVCEIAWDNVKYCIGSLYLPSGAGNHGLRKSILEWLRDELYRYIAGKNLLLKGKGGGGEYPYGYGTFEKAARRDRMSPR
jgi:hypothetical protein